jgi:hypothetical protein
MADDAKTDSDVLYRRRSLVWGGRPGLTTLLAPSDLEPLPGDDVVDYVERRGGSIILNFRRHDDAVEMWASSRVAWSATQGLGPCVESAAGRALVILGHPGPEHYDMENDGVAYRIYGNGPDPRVTAKLGRMTTVIFMDFNVDATVDTVYASVCASGIVEAVDFIAVLKYRRSTKVVLNFTSALAAMCAWSEAPPGCRMRWGRAHGLEANLRLAEEGRFAVLIDGHRVA